MDRTRWPDVERVLDLALDSDPADWGAILDRQCSGDPELRQEVEALLGRYQSAQRFLESPPAAAAAALVGEARTRNATYNAEARRVGAYRLVRRIGHGGTSLVFLAERDDGQFAQQVALKLLRPGHDSEIDQRRFRAERQILASLSHPNVARLLDGGVTDDGLPYIVMELVDGQPIDRYCEAHALPLRRRLAMFITVAEATQYAHRNLVVHRDLKPSNILVNADGGVKLLDFGLAKLVEPSSGEGLAPLTTQRWMTPEYAAPEQVRGEPATTLTDVYQLGVVLYELLSGKLPFGTRQQSAYELERAILERDAPPPSSIASQPALRGDLDAIVLKAIRKEPEHRYASAQAMADDIRRHLSGHPVLARRQTAGYRARRFARRNALALAAGAAGLIVIAAYAATVTVQRDRVARALELATIEGEKADQVAGLLLEMFESSGQGRAFTDTVTARALLGRGVTRASELADQPVVQGQMLDMIGHLYYLLGDVQEARRILTEALDSRRRGLGSGHPDVAMTLNNLGVALAGLGDYTGAVVVHREALAIRRESLGPDHSLTLRSTYDLAMAIHESGDAAGARALWDQWATVVAAQPTEETEARASELVNLGQILSFSDRLAADTLFRRALAIRRAALGPRHPAVGQTLHAIGENLRAVRRLDESEVALREGVEILRAAHPNGHRDLGQALRSLGNTLEAQRRWKDAEQVYLEVARHERRLPGRDNTTIGIAMENLGTIYREQGDHARAERSLREAEGIFLAQFGEKSPMLMRVRVGIGDALRERGALAEAESLLLTGYAAMMATRMPGTASTKRLALESLVKLYQARGSETERAKYQALLDSLPPLRVR